MVEVVNRYVGLFSGGKDSLTACHYMWSKGLLTEVLYCNTGIGLQENVEFVHQTCDKYGWILHEVNPQPNESYEDFIRKFGFPHSGMHSAIMGYLKWHPIRKFGIRNRKKGQQILFVTGRRRKESNRRMRTVKGQLERAEAAITFYSPLYEWTTAQVWQYVKSNGLSICPVYETLHLSGDCLCGAFAELGESELISTFHKRMADRIAELEHQFGGKWGNGSAMRGAMKQDKILNYICGDCIVRS